MAKSLLEIGSILPPLLEQQISPPYRIVAQHLDYLQKWRKYLLWVWSDDSNEGMDHTDIQNAVDDLISTILLIGFVRQTETTAIPSLEEILENVNKPTAYNLCETIYNRVPCHLLRCIFDPNLLNRPNIEPQKNVEWSSLIYIPEAIDALYGSRMPITLFGGFHQMCLDRPVADKTVQKEESQRRNKGIHYTPAPLVDYLVFHTLKRAFEKSEPEQVQQLQVLDPSCGYGAFLIATLHYILKWFNDRYKGKKQLQYLNPQKSLELLQSMIFGTDIDDRAIQWTRKLLLLMVWDYCLNSAVSKSDIQNLNIPDLKENIACVDFLQTYSDDCEKPPLMDKSFDIVIGGPPFVRVQELYKSNPGLIDDYKRRFRTAKTGQFDLYMLFIENSIQLLAGGGYLSMSVSNSFLRSESGRSLRKLIAKTCCIDEIAEFEDSRLYPNAHTPIALLLLRNISYRGSTKYVFIKGKGGLRRKLSKIDKLNNRFIQVCNLPGTACTSANWVLISKGKTDLLSKIESIGIVLGKLPIKIHFGVATGADDVFLLRSVEDLNSQLVLVESRFLDDVFVFESSVLRPILRGRHIKGYSTTAPQTSCIFPYDNTGKVIAEDIFGAEFPRAFSYLMSCREKLNSRKLKPGQPWYAFRSEGISQVMQSPKLVASVVNSGGAFSLDDHEHIFCNNSVIILRPDASVINPYFLLGILNSSLFKIWAQHRMPTLDSGWHSYRVKIIARFSIPIPQSGQNKELSSEIADLARKLLCGKFDEEHRPEIISSIDCKVSKLYGVSELLPDGKLRE